MEPKEETTSLDNGAAGTMPAKELAMMFPSPNWFYPLVLAVSSDGWVIYGGMTRGLCILQPAGDNYKVHIVSYAHGDRVNCVTLSDDWLTDRRLLTGSIDGVVKQWRIQVDENDVIVLPINAHNVHKTEKEEVISIMYCGENSAVSIGTSGVLVKWDLAANITRVYKKMLRHFKPTYAARCPHGPMQIAIGTKQGVLFLVDFHAKANILYKVKGHDDDITGISWCPQSAVSIQKPCKYTAAIRMEKIRNSTNDSEPAVSGDTEDKQVNKEIADLNNTEKDEGETKCEEILDQSNASESTANETVVEEDKTFDIYADHEEEEFGHKKFQPELIRVPVEKKEEKPDFLAECLKLKKDIMDNKNKQEESIHSLVESMKKSTINAEVAQDAETEAVKNDHVNSDEKQTESNKNAKDIKSMQIHINLLSTIDKNGKICIWSKSGKLLAHSFVSVRGKHTKGATATHGALHWYRADVLLAADGKSSVVESNPLVVDSTKIEFKNLHSAHKRGLYCITSANGNGGGHTDDIWTVAQDRNLVVYSYSKRAVTAVYGTFGGFVYHINQCPYDAQKLALASGDGNVRVYELSDDPSRPRGRVTCYWQNVQGRITITAWHPTRESMLAFATAEGRVGLLDPSGGKEKAAWVLGSPLRRGVYSLSWSGYSTLYVCCMGELFLYDISKKDIETTSIGVTFEGKSWSPTECSWYERGLCVGSKDGEVAVMTSTMPHQVIAACFPLQKMVQCITWHPQNVTVSEEDTAHKNWIAASSQENDFLILHLCEEGGSFKLKEVARVTGHKQAVVRVAWSPHTNGQILSTSMDATVRVWNISLAGEVSCSAVFDRHQFNTLAASWWPQPDAPDAIMSGGADHTLRIWRSSQFPPELAVDKSSSNKNMQFAMASSECDPKKEKTKDKSNDKTSAEHSDDETIEKASGDLAVNYDKVKKKIDKKSLFPISHKQMSSNGIGGCRKLLKRHKHKSGDLESENGDCDGDKGIEFIKLFGNQDEFDQILDLEQEEHLSRGRLDLWCVVGFIRGHIERVFNTAATHDALSPFLLSVAPMVSHRFWKDQMQVYMSQLERKTTDKQQKMSVEFEECSQFSTTGVHRKLILLLSQHNVAAAVELLAELLLYREAYVLARVRHMDSLADEMLVKWSLGLFQVGNRVQAAVIYLAQNKLVEAATLLSKLSEQEALDVAAEIAKVTGQETFADSLVKKRDVILRRDEILESLPERLALHLKIVKEEKEKQENGEKVKQENGEKEKQQNGEKEKQENGEKEIAIGVE